jgi:hypothetical protein
MLYVSQSSNSRHTFGVLRYLYEEHLLARLRIETGRYELCGFGGTKKGLPVEFRGIFGYVGAVICANMKMKFIFY